MEQGLLVAISLLPLGLVAVVAYLMVTRKKKQAPKLALVTNESIKKMQSLSSRMGQLNAESQRDEDADSASPVVKTATKKKAKKKSRRGKRK